MSAAIHSTFIFFLTLQIAVVTTARNVTLKHYLSAPEAAKFYGFLEPIFHPDPDCPASSWPAGSAFFTLATLAIACIAHPSGSFVLNRSRRLWRLVPIFVVAEIGTTLWY